ncbi:MAG: ATPase, T2SS/T4P/T4SS family [Enterobacterales bacterium]|nr:ATPase, T2SS/T4P/T4SS family [Enterobacterales bacterium]
MLAPTELPPYIAKGDYLEILLQRLVQLGADDLLITSDEYVYLKLNKQILPLTNRPCNSAEVDLFAAYLNNGISVSGITGQGKALDSVINLPLTDDLQLMSSEQRKGLLQGDNLHRFRVNISRCEGLRNSAICLTIRRISAKPLSLQQIGFKQTFADQILQRKIGITLIAGATGQGKSTTLASIIAYLLSKPQAHENIVTVESPIEYVYFSVKKPSATIKQMQVGRDVDSFSGAVRRMLRMALTTGVVGEMRDADTISRSCLLAQSGHRVLSTVHANNVAQIIPRCVAAFDQSMANQIRAELIANINCLIAQQLLRDTKGKMVAVREVLYFSADIRRELSLCKISELDQLVQKQVAEQGVSFAKDAQDLYLKGKISKQDLEQFLVSRA